MASFIPSKTLVIRLSSIGDIVLTTPLLRSFRKRFPDCGVDYVVKKEFADLLKYNPHIDTVHPFDARGGIDELRRLREQLRENRYELVIDLHNNIRSRFIRRKLRARKIVTIDKRMVPRFFLIKMKWNLYRDSVHVVDRYLETVEPFGVRNDDEGLELAVPQIIREHVADQFGPLGRERPFLIGLCPSAKHYTKRWLKEYYVRLAVMLVREYGACIVLFGGPDDRAYCEDIRRLIGTENTINVAGEVTLLQSAAIMDHCTAVVTNDTGLMHIAAARKRNLIAIFGPTVRELGFFPYGTRSTVIEHPDLSCRPCTHIGSNACPKKHFRCMKEITPDRVFSAVENMMRTAGSPDDTVR
jgi:lipopolysaccharide heptosyltransferase II